jgi:hypothetical protein
VLSGTPNSAIVAESKGFIQTDADELEVEELLPRLEGGPRDHSVSNSLGYLYMLSAVKNDI